MAEAQIRTAPTLGDFPAIASRLIQTKKTFKWTLLFIPAMAVWQTPLFLSPFDPFLSVLGAGMIAYFAGLFGGAYYYHSKRLSQVNNALPQMSVPRIEGGFGWCIVRQKYSAPAERVGHALEHHLRAISGDVVKDSQSKHYVATGAGNVAEANIYGMRDGGTGLDAFVFGWNARNKEDDLLSRLESLR